MLAFFSSLLVVGLGVAWKLAFLNFFFVAAKGLERIGLEMGIRLHKLRHKLIEKAEEIIEHKDLAITVRTGADPDGGNGHLLCNSLGQLCRNRFEHDSEGAGCFKGLGIIQQSQRMI